MIEHTVQALNLILAERKEGFAKLIVEETEHAEEIKRLLNRDNPPYPFLIPLLYMDFAALNTLREQNVQGLQDDIEGVSYFTILLKRAMFIDTRQEVIAINALLGALMFETMKRIPTVEEQQLCFRVSERVSQFKADDPKETERDTVFFNLFANLGTLEMFMYAPIVKGNKASVLDDYPIYDIHDVAAQFRALLLRQKVQKEYSKQESKQENNVVVYFDEIVWGAQDKKRFNYDLKETLHMHSKIDADLPWHRHLTKHRCVVSEVECYGSGFGEVFAEEKEPFTVVLVTGCAPNLSRNDLKDFKTFTQYGVFTDKGAAYFDMMKLLFKRWLAALDQAGVSVALVPMIGGGVYLRGLQPDSRLLARQLIHQALFAAVKEFPFNNIVEVMYVLPDEHGKVSDAFLQAVSVLRDDTLQLPDDAPTISLMRGGVLNLAHRVTESSGHRCGIVNPGADRTIGGRYEYTAYQLSSPLEELIFNVTNAERVQCIDQNTEDHFLAVPFHQLHPDLGKPAEVQGQVDTENNVCSNIIKFMLDSEMSTNLGSVDILIGKESRYQICFSVDATYYKFTDFMRSNIDKSSPYLSLFVEEKQNSIKLLEMTQKAFHQFFVPTLKLFELMVMKKHEQSIEKNNAIFALLVELPTLEYAGSLLDMLSTAVQIRVFTAAIRLRAQRMPDPFVRAQYINEMTSQSNALGQLLNRRTGLSRYLSWGAKLQQDTTLVKELKGLLQFPAGPK